MDENQKKVEAVLFTVGREISAERLASLCSLSLTEVQSTMKELMVQYAQRENALKIEQRQQGWKLTVRDEFVPLVSSITQSLELERPLMETLAVIAWKYPIVQSEVIKLRGSGAYEHMKVLGEQGFIEKVKFQRTFKVKLTPKFFEYFDLPSEEAKQAFLKKVPAEVLQEAEQVEKETEEAERLQEVQQKEQEVKGELRKAVEKVRRDGL